MVDRMSVWPRTAFLWMLPRARSCAGSGIDTVVCLNVLEHIEQDAATLEDFASVLDRWRPAGPARAGDARSLRLPRRPPQSLPAIRSRAARRARDPRRIRRADDSLPESPGCVRLVAQLARAEALASCPAGSSRPSGGSSPCSGSRRRAIRRSGCRSWCSRRASRRQVRRAPSALPERTRRRSSVRRGSVRGTRCRA